MLPLLLAAAVAAPGPADTRSAEARFNACTRLSDSDPAAAQKEAIAWAKTGGGVAAAQCLGIARSTAGDWKGAVDAFTTAATLADQTHEPVAAANMWVSAGNAALAGGDFAKAREALSTAIASPVLPDTLKGEAYLDRARAAVGAGDAASARPDLDQAVKLVPDDPMAWLLSATLARRLSDTTRAKADINEAMLKAPNQSDILFEAGNIAATAGDMDDARAQWTRAVSAEPGSDGSNRAKAELAATGGSTPAPAAKPKPRPQGR
ncbi:tetratricopeptide repeat protein [Sphingomonas sp. MAH-6]|nr:tetratricopeptide repeat protein [Sphingomonas chungangi]